MKCLKRALSLMLTFTLFVAGLIIPSGLPALAAENTPTLGSSSVPSTPRELSYAGEWAYWIEDGCAYIAGYSNLDEESLRIPGSLAGAPVVGIGGGAFKANSRLESMQIHTNVTKIAEDAFSGLGVTIRAYHGAYALQYASANGIRAVDLSTVAKFAADVIDLTGLPSSKAYSRLSDTGVVFAANESSFLAVGQVLYFPAQSGYPTGLAKTVSDISIQNSETRITFSQPEWGEVFLEVAGSDDLLLDWENMQVDEGFELEDFSASSAAASDATLSLSLKGDKWSMSGSLKVEVTKPKIDYEIDWRWKGLLRVPDIKYMKATLPISLTPSVEVKYKDDDNVRLLNRRQFVGHKVDQKRVKMGRIPAFSAAGVINGYVSLDLLCEVSGSLEVSWTIESTLTITLQNGKATRNIDRHFSKSKVELSGGLKFGPEVSIYLVLGWAGFSIRFFEVKAGIYVNIEGSIANESCTGSVDGIIHGDITISVDITISGKVGLIEIAGWDVDASVNISKTFGPWVLAWLHVDYGEKFYVRDTYANKCIMMNRTVVFTNDGKTVSTKKYDVNARVTQPSQPSKSGNKFAGWYVDVAKSGLTGKDHLFNFSKNPMPYISLDGTLYLYAKWTAIGASGNTPTPPPTADPGVPTVPPATLAPTPTPKPDPVRVSRITLNMTSAMQYNDDPSKITALTASVYPANADDASVTWTSSDASIVYVNDKGEFGVGDAGVATITCRSVSDPQVTATCTVTVRQRVQQIYVEGDTSALLPGETAQLRADCYPDNANDKSVVWTSSNANVVTVNAAGKVTAVGYGDAVVTAKTKDGSNLSATYPVRVERELALETSVVNDATFIQNDEELCVAYVSLTTKSMRRMALGGHKPKWTLSKKSGGASATLNEIETTFTEAGTTYDSSLVMLTGTDFPSAGKTVFTVTCSAGPYTASVDVSVNVDGTAYADRVKLDPSTFYMKIGETALIPNRPASADGKPVPPDLSTYINGDGYYIEHASESKAETGTVVSFDASGIYSAHVIYERANKSYSVPVTFYVRDADGIVRLRVQDIALDQSHIQMVQGETCPLIATIVPNDAYDTGIIWSTSDPSVASVSAGGVVSALKPGVAAIYGEAADGSGAFGMCSVSVEAYLQLDEEETAFTVYTNAEDHADLGIINLSYASQQRLIEDGLNVTWKLTRDSGAFAEIALEEFRNAAEDGVSVSGNIIKLVRINRAGEDKYTLTCSAGGFSDQCAVRIRVLDESLPTSVRLSQSAFTGSVNERISMDLQPICAPTGTKLPEGALVTVDGSPVFLNALSAQYSFAEPGELFFEKAGTYSASVTFSGDNYSYTCPVTVTVKDDMGMVPKNISEITVAPERLTMLVGENASLSAKVLPADASYSKLSWSSSDTSVVSVSAAGRVSAIGPGMTTVLVSAPETDIVGACLITVEDGLTLETEALERTVFLDGATRMRLDTLMLTEASSLRQTTPPKWTLTRISGNNLTLRAEGYQTVNDSGDTLYGCDILLHSVSRVGDTVYELSCESGGKSVKATVTVHAVDRDTVLPAGIELREDTFTADIGELIVVHPSYVCYPAGTDEPGGMKVSIEGDGQFTAALNARDYFVSQGLSTLSFGKAGTYRATYVMQYANVRYVVPLVFRVRNALGDVPVQASEVQLNYANRYMVAGETVALAAVFSPSDATNQNVAWKSSDVSVAKVNSAGKVTAVANGTATITCTPEDTEVKPISCAITVEDYLTVIPGNTSMVLYLQGEQENTIATAALSVGTAERLANAGLTPQWEVKRSQAARAELKTEVVYDGTAVNISSASLLSAGTETYTVICSAGAHTWRQEYTLIVRDAGEATPTAISMKTPNVNANVNQPVTLDFTPVLTPANARIPSGMRSTYVGLGGFYDARDDGSYSADGDSVTVTFTKAGKYILTRRYRMGNMQFVVPCVIQVGGEAGGFGLLNATETDFTVYSGGRSGSVSTVSLSDHMVQTLWGDSIRWSASRVSGQNLNVALKREGSSAEVFVADVEQNGTDVWRVTAEFGGLSESVDIRLTAAQPRGPLPESIALADDTLAGVIGTWINVPLNAACLPAGSMLPDQGEAFWSIDMDVHGTDRSVSRIENGMARFCFVESGYYTALLRYASGNVGYSIPVYFEIRDEEDVVSKPALRLFLVNASPVVYPEGEIGVVISQAVVAETMSPSNIGASLAYMNGKDAEWSISVSGTAASLKLIKSNANTCELTLTGIQGPGDVGYTVYCKVGGATYSQQGSLHVAGSAEERPKPTLTRTSYQVVQGERVVIDRMLYSKKDGSALQSSGTWNPSSFLAAVGYEVQEQEDKWLMTFYKAGEYSTMVDGYVGNLKLQAPLRIQVLPVGSAAVPSIMKPPASLTEIREEAFRGVTANVVDLRETNVTVIGTAAFRDCVDLLDVYLPASVTSIADDAFYGCLHVKLHCPAGSYAESYARAHGIDAANG